MSICKDWIRYLSSILFPNSVFDFFTNNGSNSSKEILFFVQKVLFESSLSMTLVKKVSLYQWNSLSFLHFKFERILAFLFWYENGLQENVKKLYNYGEDYILNSIPIFIKNGNTFFTHLKDMNNVELLFLANMIVPSSFELTRLMKNKIFCNNSIWRCNLGFIGIYCLCHLFKEV